MTMNVNNDALSVVRAYHRGWTTKHFDESTRLLSAELKVEVPINNYPTTESFAKAVVVFGMAEIAQIRQFSHCGSSSGRFWSN